MKRALNLLILLMLFSSCLTVRQIEKNCDKFAKICITETVTETVYRDTTIYRTDTLEITLPKDTVRLRDTLTIVKGMAFLPTIHKRFGIIGVDAGVSYSVLTVTAYLTDSTILYTHKDTLWLEKVIKEKAITHTVVVKHVPKLYKWSFWILVVGVLLFIVLIILKIKIGAIPIVINKILKFTK